MASKFAVGDLVSYVNDYGVKFPERRIVGSELVEGREPRYFLEPTDAPWFSVRESSLILDADDPVLCVENRHKIRNTTVGGDDKWFLIGTSTRNAYRTIALAKEVARGNP